MENSYRYIHKDSPLAMGSGFSFMVDEQVYTLLLDLVQQHGIRTAVLLRTKVILPDSWEKLRQSNQTLSGYDKPLPFLSEVYPWRHDAQHPVARPLSSTSMKDSWVPIMAICQRTRNLYLEVCELAAALAKDKPTRDKFDKIKRELRILQRTHYRMDKKLREKDEYYYLAPEFDENGLTEVNPIGEKEEWNKRTKKVEKEYEEEAC